MSQTKMTKMFNFSEEAFENQVPTSRIGSSDNDPTQYHRPDHDQRICLGELQSFQNEQTNQGEGVVHFDGNRGHTISQLQSTQSQEEETVQHSPNTQQMLNQLTLQLGSETNSFQRDL